VAYSENLEKCKFTISISYNFSILGLKNDEVTCFLSIKYYLSKVAWCCLLQSCKKWDKQESIKEVFLVLHVFNEMATGIF